MTILAILALAVFAPATSLAAIEISGPSVKAGALTINKAAISDKASFFPLTVNGVPMEVFAVKAADGSIRTAFNTCQVCFNSGRGWYVQEGKQMVCQNCGNRFGIDQIELIKGGCNPVPITSEYKKDSGPTITISSAFLEQNLKFFKRWKREGQK
jgi:uncharacterized membrane protein